MSVYSVYSVYRVTYIQLNEYWIKMYGLDINKKYYISIDNWLELMQQESITIKDMNNIIKDLHLEKEVSLMNEEKKKGKDEDEDLEEARNLARNKWIQRQQFFDYCLQDFKKGRQWDTTTSSLVVKLAPQSSVKSVGKIIPTKIIDEITDETIYEIIDDSCGYDNSNRTTGSHSNGNITSQTINFNNFYHPNM
jgi:hypothetical protein